MAKSYYKNSINYRPFVRWWWFGNAITKNEITRELTELQQQKFGGVEIQPIYSAQPKNNLHLLPDIPWLSPEWIELVCFACQKGKELGLDTDLTFGTGWPFGGPHIPPSLASTRLSVYNSTLEKGLLELELSDLFEDESKIITVFAIDGSKPFDPTKVVNLKEKTDSNSKNYIKWMVPSVDWKMFWFVCEPTKQEVKRATIGGEGYVLDHLNHEALRKHADYIINPFKLNNINSVGDLIGAFFCDSWEVYGENWTSNFPEKFKMHMGYDITHYIPFLIELLGDRSLLQSLQFPENQEIEDIRKRIMYDYRKVHSDLILTEFFAPFSQICHNNHVKSRVQPYSAPTDLLRAYGTFDILEIEGFGKHGIGTQYYGNVDPRLASSAAHIYGKDLVSCESFTWLGEHFTVSLDQLKKEVDQIILHGIQRIIYHGCPASPPEAGNPGWVFYASILANWNNSWWPYIKELNEYITKNAEMGHQGTNVSDFAVYLPIHDEWMGKKTILKDLRVILRDCGHFSDFDYINDECLNKAIVENKRLKVGDGDYYALIFWETEYLPIETMRKIEAFQQAGLIILLIGKIPYLIPGYSHIILQKSFEIPQFLTDQKKSLENVRYFSSFQEMETYLEQISYIPDVNCSTSIKYLHRKLKDSDEYFLVNSGEKPFTGDIYLRTSGNGKLYDILHNQYKKIKLIPVEKNGEIITKATISLAPFESNWLLIDRTGEDMKNISEEIQIKKEIIPISTKWNIIFSHQGNSFPKEGPFKYEKSETELFDWTSDPNVMYYSGTAKYQTTFEFPMIDFENQKYCLHLGELHEIAEIMVNDISIGTIWTGIPEIDISKALKTGPNYLEIKVTNLLINKIIGYEQAGIKWCSDYYFVNIDYKPFDVAKMTPYPSGLIGPLSIKVYRLKNQ
jgi:hypothetical protein